MGAAIVKIKDNFNEFIPKSKLPEVINQIKTNNCKW